MDILVEFEKAKEIKEMALAFEDITEAKINTHKEYCCDESRFNVSIQAAGLWTTACPPHP